MMEEPLSRGASPSGNSSLSVGGEMGPTPTSVALEERLLDVTTRHSLNLLRTPPTKKAKRIRFFRNGDKFYTGVVMAVTAERYRSFDSLATDLTRALISNVTLPNGVRAIYTMDGRKVGSVGDLEDGKCYVCSGQGETFKKVEYSASKVRRGSSLSGLPQSPAGAGRPTTSVPLCVQAKIVTLIRHGTKPRRVLRLLLNKRNAPSLEHALEAITEAVKLDSGAVRKVYTLSAIQVTTLDQFFQNEEIFLAYGGEKSCQEDFELDFEESKAVQSFRKGPCLSKRHGGPMPPMPKKSGKKTLSIPQVRTPSPVFVQLPLPLRMHFLAGHVIGDGNFAVVRHCIQRKTGLEYALKIIDKYKCQGQGTMLESEIAIMRQVCHPNIISLIAEQETTDQLFLVMELVKGGDLFDAIAAATKFSEPEASVMINHLTSALAYLHAHHIVHRDVKPENLLVEMEGSRVTCLKLGDFGLARVVREPLYTVCGTPTYVAPEILAETGYGLKIDVWAVGVIMYILLCGFPPFVSRENEQEELFERILSGHYEYTAPYWDSVSESAKQLISNMLQIQPELRFSAEDVLDHPWLASFLGGEQIAAATDPESAEQYWHKQRKPIRQATFDFNYDYEARKQQAIDSEGQYHPWFVAQDRWSEFGKPQKSHNNAPLSLSDTRIHEIDLPNGYYNANEPQSLEINCLDDIRAMTKSMHDLMDDITQMGDNDPPIERPNSVSESTTAFNGGSINQNGNIDGSKSCEKISTVKNNGKAKSQNGSTRGKESEKYASKGSAKSIDKLDDEKAKSRRNNFSSLDVSNKNKNKNKNKDKNKNENENNKLSKFADKLFRDSVAVDFSVDSNNEGRSSSDNDIETSDSFVNVKFFDRNADGSSRSSGSSQSIESTDSFENIRFTKFTTIDSPSDTEDNDIDNDDKINKDKDKNRLVNSETKKLRGKNLIKIDNSASRSVVSKSTNNSRRPIQPQDSLKTRETVSKYSERSAVVRREKKPGSSRGIISNSTDELSSTRNEVTKRKRFSYHTPQVVQQFGGLGESKNKKVAHDGAKNASEKLFNEKISRDVVDKKFSSNDELRETTSGSTTKQQKDSAALKAKRYSLYYTPQPSRKNYVGDSKESAKSAKKLTNKTIVQSSADRQLPTAELGDNQNPTDTATAISSNPRKDVITKSRKSVAQTTTAASRNRSNKQSIHLRQEIANASLTKTK